VADRTAAFEWVSLFAHDIVFAHFYCGGSPVDACPARNSHRENRAAWPQ
jgi:hypothetical protein